MRLKASHVKPGLEQVGERRPRERNMTIKAGLKDRHNEAREAYARGAMDVVGTKRMPAFQALI